jgi:hypothetical protein
MVLFWHQADIDQLRVGVMERLYLIRTTRNRSRPARNRKKGRGEGDVVELARVHLSLRPWGPGTAQACPRRATKLKTAASA